MKQFIAVVHQEADSAFGVHFPDAPGCFSAADSIAELLPNATAALSLYFEDQDAPAPQSLDEIRQSAKSDLDQGAFLMAVPLLQPANHQVRVNISLDKATLQAIDKTARSRHLTRSAFLAQAAVNEIEGRH